MPCQKSYLWKGEWAIGSAHNFEISLIFPRKSCGNPYTKFIIVKIKSRFAESKSNLFIILFPGLYDLKYSIFSCPNTHLFLISKYKMSFQLAKCFKFIVEFVSFYCNSVVLSCSSFYFKRIITVLYPSYERWIL